MFHTKHPSLVYGSGTKDLYASREYSHHMARVLSRGSESSLVWGVKAVSQSGVTTLGSG